MPSLLLFLIIGIKILMPLLNLTTSYEQFASHLLSLLIIAFVAWLFIIAIAVVRKFYLRKYSIYDKDNLKARMVATKLSMIEKILEFLIIVVAISFALMTFEQIRRIGMSLLASAGIAGIIIGFAAQKIIATILAGFQIAITQPIRIDDVVIVEGEWGW
ncbi:MAG: mechanosensitive ion channel, partial [Bacteroidetes bacterium]|nr:mechanosensitive ion channel [Bacteroidota bacterium]